MVEKPLFTNGEVYYHGNSNYTNGNQKNKPNFTGAVTSPANGPYAGYGTYALYGTRIYLIGAYGVQVVQEIY